MVARTPPKQKNLIMVAPLNPILIRETVKKVDQCMERLQELQYTVTGGTKVVSAVTLSPRSTRVYLKTSLRCKQESVRIRSGTSKKSPTGKFSAGATGEWRRMSLTAMLVGETVGEILQASKFAKETVETMSKYPTKAASDDPKTPVTLRGRQRPNPENTGLEARRKREKQHLFRIIRSGSSTPTLRRARSRINFKVSPPRKAEFDKENCSAAGSRYLANRVSPKNRPWVKKTVLFPNPLFHSSPNSQHQKFCKTKSPIIAKKNNKQTPHKFLIKSPPSATSKFQVKIKSPVVTISPPRPTAVTKKSPVKLLSTASKLRRSLSPSRLANRMVSPLRSRRNVQKKSDVIMMSWLKQRPTLMMPMRFSARNNDL